MTDLIFHPATFAPELTHLWSTDSFNTARLQNQIDRESFVLRLGGTDTPVPYAYTVGLTSLGFSELIFYGHRAEHLYHAWELLEPVLEEILEPALTLIRGQFDGLTATVRHSALPRLSDAYRLYGAGGFSALQVYWVVGSGNHLPQPWEINFLASQPFLGTGTLGDLNRN
ncbi:hypothetical protein [Arthrobacter sp. H5]|uniref:hypothetical protein n=1 Tax=Arthrobacter sp. H5 TaxID=1267973 RepID=UPI00048533E1|nr:hypothetical protein [Arthrobacter sp. H5]